MLSQNVVSWKHFLTRSKGCPRCLQLSCVRLQRMDATRVPTVYHHSVAGLSVIFTSVIFIYDCCFFSLQGNKGCIELRLIYVSALTLAARKHFHCVNLCQILDEWRAFNCINKLQPNTVGTHWVCHGWRIQFFFFFAKTQKICTPLITIDL